MDINSMITLANGQNYILMQEVEYEGNKYFLAMGCDERGFIQKKYAIIKETTENGKTFADFLPATEKETEAKLLELFAKDFVEEVDKDVKFLKVGQVVEMNGRDYTVVDFIPMYDNLYAIFVTLQKPLDIMVCRRSVNNKGEEEFVNVTTLDEGVAVLQIHSALHSNTDTNEE